MADEMNNNLNSQLFNDIKSTMNEAEVQKKHEKELEPLVEAMSVNSSDLVPIIPIKPSNLIYKQAYNDFGCLVHTNSDKFSSNLQKSHLCTKKMENISGIWDHKLKIYPIWGARNRLGNADHLFYYDIWSNMHYGFIGKKLSITDGDLLFYASLAQFADHLSFKGDDPRDANAIKEGIMLSNKKHISIDDLINVVEKHYDWFYLE